MEKAVLCWILFVSTFCGVLSADLDYKDNLLRFVSDKALNHLDKLQYSDCHDVRQAGGYNESGVYMLHLNKSSSYKVLCEFTPDNSLTVVQKRVHGTENFKRPFHDYLYGFGNINSDYWAGLNQMFYLTSTGNNVLTIYIQNWNGLTYTLRYNHFRLTDSINFRLQIGGYQGQLTDDLGFNNGMNFATFDRPDPNHCATNQHAGWWYNYCSYALPNGQYYYGGPYQPTGGYYDGIYWKDWMGYGYSMKFFSMSLSKY